MTDKIQRPLSAEVADAAQKRSTAPQSTERATGAVVPRMEYRITHSTPGGYWYTHRKIGLRPFRQALLLFRTCRGECDTNGQMRLEGREVTEWHVVADEGTLAKVDQVHERMRQR